MNVALKRICIALTLCSGLMLVSQAHAGFIEFNGHYYERTSEPLTWQGAEAQAVGLGGHLAAITSQAEQDFLTANFAVNEDIWIGLTDQATEGVFLWSSMEAVTYTAFFPGEPNDLGGNERYVNMNLGSGLWNDNDGDSLFSGIIELSSNPVPEPASIIMLGLGTLGIVVCVSRRTKTGVTSLLVQPRD